MGTWQGRLGVAEFATAGTDPDTGRLIAARVGVLDADGSELARWDWGSERADAAVGEVTQTLRTLLTVGIPIATFDAAASLTILDREARRRHLEPLSEPFPILDPTLLDQLLEPNRSDDGLGAERSPSAMAQRYGVVPGSLAAGRLVHAMAEQLAGEPTDWHRRQREHLDFWPVVPLDDIRRIEDTQPIPAPAPRPSETVPTFDFGDDLPRDFDSGPTTPTAAPPSPRGIQVVAAIVTDSAGRAVVVRERGAASFRQPGGTIQHGESASATLVRELRAELGLVVVVEETEFLGSFSAPALNEPGEIVHAEVFALTTDTALVAGSEIEELRWLESPFDVDSVHLAPLTTDVLLPLWATRRTALF